MRALILLSDESPSGEQFCNELNMFAGDDYESRRYSEIVVCVKDGGIRICFVDDGTDLRNFDLVYLRGITYGPLRHVIAVYLQKFGVAIVNSESFEFQNMTKLEQNIVLALNDIPVADSLYVADRNNYEAAITKFNFSFPLIAKAIDGKNGKNNEMVRSLDELNVIEFDDLVLQPFLPNDFDYRVIVAGGEVILAYKRIRNVAGDDYKNNISQGGTREVVELPEELKRMAVGAAHAVGREFCGLDILTNKETGESVVLEVNFNFGTPEFDDKGIEVKFYHDVAGYFTSLGGN